MSNAANSSADSSPVTLLALVGAVVVVAIDKVVVVSTGLAAVVVGADVVSADCGSAEQPAISIANATDATTRRRISGGDRGRVRR